MRSTSGAIVALFGMLSVGAHAQPAPATGTPLAMSHGRPYDVVANCLMQQTANRQFAAWPLVYAPPRREALVNVWIRGRDLEPPVGVFHVVQDDTGTTSVSFEGTRNGPGSAAVEAAARRCTR